MDRISGDIRKIGGRRCNCASAQESLRQKDREKENEYVYSFLARVSRKTAKRKRWENETCGVQFKVF